MGGANATYTYSATDGFAKPIAYADGVNGRAVRLAKVQVIEKRPIVNSLHVRLR